MYPPCNDAFLVTNANLTKTKFMPKEAFKEKNTFVSIGLFNIYITSIKKILISMWKCCLHTYIDSIKLAFVLPTGLGAYLTEKNLQLQRILKITQTSSQL